MEIKNLTNKTIFKVLEIPEKSPFFVLKNDCKNEEKKNVLELAEETKLLTKEQIHILNWFINVDYDNLTREKIYYKVQLVDIHIKCNIPGIKKIISFTSSSDYFPEKEYLDFWVSFRLKKPFPSYISDYNALYCKVWCERSSVLSSYLKTDKDYENKKYSAFWDKYWSLYQAGVLDFFLQMEYFNKEILERIYRSCNVDDVKKIISCYVF